MKFDSLIFDLDGTLWDVNPTVAKARNNVLRERGIAHREFTGEDVARHVGLPVDEVYRRAFPEMSEGQREELRPAISAEIRRLIPIEGAYLYPGVREGLERLRARYPLFIVSNCSSGYIEAFLAWSGLGPRFVDHECYGNTRESKGSNIRRVVTRNALRAPLYIGDTAGDHEAANEAGIPYAHVNYGFGDPIGPCPRYDRFEALVEALLLN